MIVIFAEPFRKQDKFAKIMPDSDPGLQCERGAAGSVLTPWFWYQVPLQNVPMKSADNAETDRSMSSFWRCHGAMRYVGEAFSMLKTVSLSNGSGVSLFRSPTRSAPGDGGEYPQKTEKRWYNEGYLHAFKEYWVRFGRDLFPSNIDCEQE